MLVKSSLYYGTISVNDSTRLVSSVLVSLYCNRVGLEPSRWRSGIYSQCYYSEIRKIGIIVFSQWFSSLCLTPFRLIWVEWRTLKEYMVRLIPFLFAPISRVKFSINPNDSGVLTELTMKNRGLS